jgi:transposase
MITMDMVGKIRRLHSRGNKSEREIARITGLSRNTVAKWLKGSVGDAPRYRRGPMAVKLTPFAAAIEQALEADAHRPRKDRRTGKALHKEISAAGYAGGYSRLTDFIREWRARRDGAGTAGAFVPLAFEMGDAFQFDWSEEALVIGGIYRKLQVSHMKLCASRAFWLVAYPSQGHEMLFDAHTRSFAALGGIARRGIYDFVPGNKIVVLWRRSLCAGTPGGLRRHWTGAGVGHKIFKAIAAISSGLDPCAIRRQRGAPPKKSEARKPRVLLAWFAS